MIGYHDFHWLDKVSDKEWEKVLEWLECVILFSLLRWRMSLVSFPNDFLKNIKNQNERTYGCSIR
jgi:hypothetical protein